MSDNLIFCGIKEELKHGEHADTDKTLRDFIKDDMKIEQNIEFQRVHRLGGRKRDQFKPTTRPVIANFKISMIRYSAPYIYIKKDIF